MALPPECVSDSDCDAGERCKNNTCVPATYGIEAPDSVPQGENVSVLITSDGLPAPGLTVMIIAPDGTQKTYVTDQNGRITFPGDETGYYIIGLAAPGFGEARVDVTAPPVNNDLLRFCWIPFVLLLLLMLLLYLRGKYTI